MGSIWGIHNDHPQLHIEDLGVVTIGWDEVGDLNELGPDREVIKAKVAAVSPQAKPGAIPVWAGVLYRFAYEIQLGDIIIYPYKPDSSLFFGRVTGPYEYDVTAEFHRNRRKVDWFLRDVPRALFSQPALNEIGSAVTVFRVSNHAAEFEAFISRGWKEGEQVPSADSLMVTQDTDAAVTQARRPFRLTGLKSTPEISS